MGLWGLSSQLYSYVDVVLNSEYRWTTISIWLLPTKYWCVMFHLKLLIEHMDILEKPRNIPYSQKRSPVNGVVIYVVI
jgi:hypothetical protein